MELDIDWVNNFELEDKEYGLFYKEKIKKIQIVYCYVNKDNHLFHCKKQHINIENSTLKKTELIKIIKDNRNHQHKTYFPLSILKYNVTLESANIKDYIHFNENDYNFMESQSSITDIIWDDSILFLNSMNSLYIVLKEKWNQSNNKTKKITIQTKKVSKKKTRRKQLKKRHT